METIDEILRRIKKGDLAYASIFGSRTKDDNKDCSKPDLFQSILNSGSRRDEEESNSKPLFPIIPDYTSILSSRRENDWQTEQDRLDSDRYYQEELDRQKEWQEEQDRRWREEQERQDRKWQEEQERTREEEFRRTMVHAWMECDIKKGMALGTSCVSHPLARLELLKMGYRP